MVLKQNYMLEHPESLSDHSVKLDKIGQSAGKSFSYLLGVYLGDGCVTLQKGKLIFRINAKDKDFVESVKEALENLTNSRINIHEYWDYRWSKPCVTYQLRCGDTELSSILRQHTKNKSIIPSYVFEWNPDIKKEFIAGLMDSEGFVAEKHNIPSDCKILTNRRFSMGYKSCDVWINDFVYILNSIGVKTWNIRVEKPLKDGYKIPSRFGIKMQSWVDAGCFFKIARKNDKVKIWSSFPAYAQRSINPKRLTPETICSAPYGDDIVQTNVESIGGIQK